MRRFVFFFLAGFLFFSTGCASVTYIPPAKPVSLPTADGIFHIVGPGETLWNIAQRYGVEVHEVQHLNYLRNPNEIQVGQRLIIPTPDLPPPLITPFERISADPSIERKVGYKRTDSKWEYITLHHSATSQGSAAAFHRDHSRRKMGGLFYHFVIGNGHGANDGEVEVGWRWHKQVRSKKDRPRDIQICLVGNFNEEDVSSNQFQSLVNLVHVLRKQYGISLRNVRRHRDIHGTTTECPGSRFPFFWVLSELKRMESGG